MGGQNPHVSSESHDLFSDLCKNSEIRPRRKTDRNEDVLANVFTDSGDDPHRLAHTVKV